MVVVVVQVVPEAEDQAGVEEEAEEEVEEEDVGEVAAAVDEVLCDHCDLFMPNDLQHGFIY